MLSRLFRRALKEEDGAIAVMFALSLLFVVPLLVLVVDMSYGYFVRAKLQTTATIGALAAGSQLDQSLSVAVMKTNARNEADLYADIKNIGVGQDGDVTNLEIDEDIIFGEWREDGVPEFLPDTDALWDETTMTRNAVKVFARRSDFGEHDNALPLFIGAVLPELNVQPYAVVTAFGGVEEEICILALEETDPDAFYINGNNTITAKDCGICSNGGIRGNGTPTVDVSDNGIILFWDGSDSDAGTGPTGDPHVLTNKGKVNWDPELPTGIGNKCEDPVAPKMLFADHWGDVCEDLVAKNPFKQVSQGPAGNGKDWIKIIVQPTQGLAICGEIRKTGSNFIVDGIPQIDSTTQVLHSIDFADGLHHFKSKTGGIQNFNLNAGADVPVGMEFPFLPDGVTILLSNIQLDWLGTSQISLVAPDNLAPFVGNLRGFTANDLAAPDDHTGFVFHQNPNSPNGPTTNNPCNDGSNLCHVLGGGNGFDVKGIMYFGRWSHLKIHGTQNTGAAVQCLAMIAGSFEFDGTTDLLLNPAACNLDNLPLAQSDLVVRVQD